MRPPTATPGTDEDLSVGEVAVRTGLSVDTLRLYERRGLFPAIGRSAGGRRRYGRHDLDRLAFLQILRATGMPLATMRTFAELRTQGEPGRPQRLALLREHRAAVQQKIAGLTANLALVDRKIARHAGILGEPGSFELLGVHHVQLAIPPGGEDACRAFWGDVLGMTELTKPAELAKRGGCWFRGGALEVHLGVEAAFVPARKAHPGLLVTGLTHLAGILEAAGSPVVWDGEFPGHDRFYSEDPFGNRLEFLEAQAG